MTKLILSLEGRDSNTEKNIFNQLIKLASFNDDTTYWFFISLDARKTSRNEQLINNLIGQIRNKLKIENIDEESIEEVYIIHDWDSKDQFSSIDNSIITIEKFLKDTKIKKIEFTNDDEITNNNIEYEFLRKMFSPIHSENELWKNHRNAMENRKNYSKGENLLSQFIKADAYDLNILKPYLINLIKNDSAYAFIIKDMFSKIFKLYFGKN